MLFPQSSSSSSTTYIYVIESSLISGGAIPMWARASRPPPALTDGTSVIRATGEFLWEGRDTHGQPIYNAFCKYILKAHISLQEMLALSMHSTKDLQLLGDFVPRPPIGDCLWALLHFPDPDFRPPIRKCLAPPLSMHDRQLQPYRTSNGR